MLSNFTLNNFYSINEEVTINFNFPSNQSKSFKQNVLFEYNDGCKRSILNGGIIFGANASGKTNIINALDVVKYYVDNSFKFDDQDEIKYLWSNFKLSKKRQTLTSFKLEFIIKTNQSKGNYHIFNYNFSIDTKDFSIVYEKLVFRKILKTKVSKMYTLFERLDNKIIENHSNINNIINKIEKDNIKHKLLISVLINDINYNYFKGDISTFEYFLINRFYKDGISKIISGNRNASYQFMSALNENSKYKKYILKNLKKSDFAIKDFIVEDISDDLMASFKQHGISEELQHSLLGSMITERSYKTYTIHNVDGQKHKLSLNEESGGTLKFLNQSYSMYEALLNSGLFIVDEFESAYHHKIQESIINNFINQENEAQFLIVSHNPLLMNKELFSKEQIMFVEKERETEQTNLFNLSDFDVSYNNHNWINLYYNGRFGGVPEVTF